jgi:uncharacterized phage protein (TIGR01671 family)
MADGVDSTCKFNDMNKREIKIRGINPYTNEFEYWDSNSNRDDDFWSFVIPETVGQYTGLKDKHGKEIYIGDILKTSNDGSDGSDVWDDSDVGLSICQEYEKELGICFTNWYPTDDNDSMYNYRYIEVIGNIHTNPELLKS